MGKRPISYYVGRHVLRFGVAVVVLLFAVGAAGAAPNRGGPGKNPPTNVTPPTISGIAEVGAMLTGNAGTWTGRIRTSAYQWQRCDAAGNNCSSISNETASTYTAVPADLGLTLRFAVVASNRYGSTFAVSDATPLVVAAPPPTTTTTTTTTTPTTTTTTTTPTTTTTTTSTTTTTPPPSGACGSRASQTPPSTYSHVVWIWMENHAYSQVIGSSSAPYENQLASECGLATNYSAVTHPSLPNYIAATSGSPQGITDDNPPSSHPLNVPSIFGQVTSGSFQESMPTNCDQGDAYPYAVKHNPEAYYTPIASLCRLQDVPLTSMDPNNLPAFSFVTPNLCNDTHDCDVATGDAWLQSFIPEITATADYQAGKTVVFLTWDEDDGSATNHVATIVLSAYTPRGTRAGTSFTHYSLLRTTEELLGVTSFLGGAATANDMRSSFHL